MTIPQALEKLSKSKFCSRFRLTADDVAYIGRVGIETVERHANVFVREKLAPAQQQKAVNLIMAWIKREVSS